MNRLLPVSILLLSIFLLSGAAGAQQIVIPDNGGKPLAEDPAEGLAREAEYSKRRANYSAILRDASAKAAEAKMQADSERRERQKAEGLKQR